MSLTVLLGGTRSGKSRLAASIASSSGAEVVVIATAEARDDEMAERIRRHRADRPSSWATVEEPLELERALAGTADDACVVLDCLTLWVSNLLEAGRSDDEVEGLARAAARASAGRAGPTVVISNEVGSGIVPINELARRYGDLLGRVNAIWVEASDRAALVVAGRALPLVPFELPVGDA